VVALYIEKTYPPYPTGKGLFYWLFYYASSDRVF